MRTITEDDLKIFEKCSQLEKDYIQAKEQWLIEVRRSHNHEIIYDETYPSFEKYKEKVDEWRKYFEKNSHILLAEVVSK